MSEDRPDPVEVAADPVGSGPSLASIGQVWPKSPKVCPCRQKLPRTDHIGATSTDFGPIWDHLPPASHESPGASFRNDDGFWTCCAQLCQSRSVLIWFRCGGGSCATHIPLTPCSRTDQQWAKCGMMLDAVQVCRASANVAQSPPDFGQIRRRSGHSRPISCVFLPNCAKKDQHRANIVPTSGQRSPKCAVLGPTQKKFWPSLTQSWSIFGRTRPNLVKRGQIGCVHASGS